MEMLLDFNLKIIVLSSAADRTAPTPRQLVHPWVSTEKSEKGESRLYCCLPGLSDKLHFHPQRWEKAESLLVENEPKLATVAFWGEEEAVQLLETWKKQLTPVTQIDW